MEMLFRKLAKPKRWDSSTAEVESLDFTDLPLSLTDEFTPRGSEEGLSFYLADEDDDDALGDLAAALYFGQANLASKIGFVGAGVTTCLDLGFEIRFTLGESGFVEIDKKHREIHLTAKQIVPLCGLFVNTKSFERSASEMKARLFGLIAKNGFDFASHAKASTMHWKNSTHFVTNSDLYVGRHKPVLST